MVQTLEYYDVPQVYVAADAMATRYLCTLFDKAVFDDYKYIGVQISEPCLMAFIGGQLDLCEAYLHPEVDNAVYLVLVQRGTLTATTLLQRQEITEKIQSIGGKDCRFCLAA